jgi:glycosyltransferase involved in cell wall biosynthesis
VFALPSLEEGSPLVSYETMALGLAQVLSPMGAGKIARPEQDGFVLDPYNGDAWVAALQKLAGDRELRQHLGQAARTRVQEFTWAEAGRRRREVLLEALAR